MKKDKILGAGGSIYAKIDDELDRMIEENLRLQDDEHHLMTKVKKLQKKKKAMLADGHSSHHHSKKLTSTVGGHHHDRSRSRSPAKKGPDFTMDLTNLRGHIEKSNKSIIDLKHDIEVSKRVTHG